MSEERVKAILSTREHVKQVQKQISNVISLLIERMVNHDNSKFEKPEEDTFAIYTAKLAGMTYGSDEYKQCLAEMKPALDHHYSVNPHHPEFHKNGTKDMTLVDILEMFCDWKAATKRHADGDIRKSIDINQQRFGYSDELKQILINSLVLFAD